MKISINGNKSILDTNYQGTQNVIGAVRSSAVKRLIHFSSIHAISHDHKVERKR